MLLDKRIKLIDTFPFSPLKFKTIKSENPITGKETITKKFIKDENLKRKKRTDLWSVTKDVVKASSLDSFQGFEASHVVFLIESKSVRHPTWFHGRQMTLGHHVASTSKILIASV